MSLISFLTSSVGGLLLGGFGQAATQALEIWRANAESKRKIEEMKVMASIKVEETSWAAFQESLKARNSSFQMPNNATVGMSWVFVLVEACVRMVNVLLTLGAVVLLWHFWQQLDSSSRSQFYPEVAAFCMACGYWWIGQRYQGKLQPGK